jgi:hypothetical protein
MTPESLTEIEQAVRQRLGGQLSEFRLSIRDAGLVLAGRARSHHAKQLVQHALIEMTPAPISANEIQVCGSPRAAPSDSGVAREATLTREILRGSPPGVCFGENSPEARRRICDGLEFIGITLDERRNTGGVPLISTADSPAAVRVIRTDEESMIARAAAEFIPRPRAASTGHS